MRTRRKVLISRVRTRAVLTPVVAFAVLAACAVPLSASHELSGRAHLRVALEEGDLSLQSGESLVESSLRGASEHAGGAGVRAPEKKNPMVALLLSAAVPGLGELYTGNTGRAKAFLSAEAAIWIGYATFTIQEDLRTEDYEEYARIFAGVSSGSSGEYYQDVADYIRSEGDDSFNEAVRAEARSLYPDDLEAQRAFFEANGYFGSSSWEWDSRVTFSEYRDLRNDAGTSRRNAFYMTGLAVLNRALSAIDSAWMARRHNSGLSGEPSARLYLTPDITKDAVGSRLGLEVSF